MITSILFYISFGATCFGTGFALGRKWQKIVHWTQNKKDQLKNKFSSLFGSKNG